jgi:FixJ family two-component response regulator
MAKDRIVFIVDDDIRVCNALSNLLASRGISGKIFGSANEYVAFQKPDCIACLLLDIDLPDINGLALQKQLAGSDHPPIIFITGFGDIPSTVQAMKAGAIDFLAKPFNQADLVRAINEAFDRDAKARVQRSEMGELRSRFSRLTRRERDVFSLVVAGFLNKQAAAELGISEITCAVHRGQVMRKMAAGSLAELVRMATKLQIPLPAVASSSQING